MTGPAKWPRAVWGSVLIVGGVALVAGDLISIGIEGKQGFGGTVWLVVLGLAAMALVLRVVALVSLLLELLFGFSASSLTNLAVLLGGRRRPALRAEWQAHLAGESGHDPVTWHKAREALGFVSSAVQYRLAGARDMAWRPADAVLGSRTLSNLFVGARSS